MKYHPIAIKLKDEPVLVVGGGKVAERKVLGLLEAGTDITVVSPRLTSKLKGLTKKGRFVWHKRVVQKNDLRGAKVIIAATNNNVVNKNVSRWAAEFGIWANIVDNVRLSSFISPAILRKGHSIVAVYTDGRDPKLSRDLKNFLKEHWDVFLSYRRRS